MSTDHGISRSETDYVVNAAGGNGTAIHLVDTDHDRAWCEREGVALMQEEKDVAEQCGFLNPHTGHFEMAGGEFCGNAARSAAMILSLVRDDEDEIDFDVSGYDGTVHASVDWLDGPRAHVRVTFDNLPAKAVPVDVEGAENAWLVDLGGIVHVVVEDRFPATTFQERHRSITEKLGLGQRGCVGVCWLKRGEDGQPDHIDPVVWVRSISSFFYESACGSGSIAAEAVTHHSSIEQPSGEVIYVHRRGKAVTLRSDMEIIRAHS